MQQSAVIAWGRPFASLRLTLAALALLALDVLLTYRAEVRASWPLAVPLALLSVNLVAAVLSNATFRRQGALLAFHLALIAIVLLILPLLWAGLRSNTFENTRWMESDHPRTSSDDDGDDE